MANYEAETNLEFESILTNLDLQEAVNNDMILTSNEINAAVDSFNGQSTQIKRRFEALQGRSSKRLKTHGGGPLNQDFTNLFHEIADNPDGEIDDNSTLFWDNEIVPDTGAPTYFDILRKVEPDDEAKKAAGDIDVTTIAGSQKGWKQSAYGRGMQAYQDELMRDAPSEYNKNMRLLYPHLYPAAGDGQGQGLENMRARRGMGGEDGDGKEKGIPATTFNTSAYRRSGLGRFGIRRKTQFDHFLGLINFYRSAMQRVQMLKSSPDGVPMPKQKVTIRSQRLGMEFTVIVDPNATARENMDNLYNVLGETLKESKSYATTLSNLTVDSLKGGFRAIFG